MRMYVRLSICTALALLDHDLPTAAAQPAPAPPPPAPSSPTDQPATPSDARDTSIVPYALPSAPLAPAPSEQSAPSPLAPSSTPSSSPSSPTSAAPDPSVARRVEWTSLRLLHAKGILSDAEYQTALTDMSGVIGAADATTLVVSKLSVTLFGYVQADFKWDSTQSCLDFCASLPIQKQGSYRGDHRRVIFSPRDSRLGIRFAAPEEHRIRASGLIEADFFGPTTTTEQGVWSNPVLRLRQAWIKLETPIVDILLGQTGNLFGWASAYLVTGSQEPGLPGQMYQRTSQLKLSRAFKLRNFTIDTAAALERPPQQDSGTPEIVGGVRISRIGRLGYHTFYLASSVLQPASVAVTVDWRRFAISEFSTAPTRANLRTGGGVAFNAFLPILTASRTSHDNALALTAEVVIGSGTSDMYTGLGSGGTVNAAIPPAMDGGTPGTYPANFDPGLAAYDVTGRLELIRWTSAILGLEFYPGGLGGRLGLWANYGHMESSNSYRYGGPDAIVNDPVLGRTREKEDFLDAGVFFDPTASTRIGTGLAYFRDRYVDATVATNYSVMTSAWLFF
jgi:hypothetical protein